MNKIANKIFQQNELNLHMSFYEIYSLKHFESIYNRALQDIENLKQKQSLESLSCVLYFYEGKSQNIDLELKIAQLIKEKTTLQELIFSTRASGELKDEGIKYIMDSIGTLNKLKVFNLDYSGEIGKDPINQLIIKDTITQLQELQLLCLRFDCSYIGSSVKNLEYLAEGIQSLKKLQQLELDFHYDQMHLNFEGIDILAQSLSELDQLQEFNLQLYKNEFGENQKSLESLSKMIGQLPQTVQKLELGLSRNNINKQSLQVINDGILQLKNLENLELKLQLEENNINDQCLQKQELEQSILGEVRDKVKNLEIIL